MMRVFSPSHPPIRFAGGCEILSEALHPQSFQQKLYEREWRHGRCLYSKLSGPAFSGDLSHKERGLVQANLVNLGAWKKHYISISLDDP